MKKSYNLSILVLSFMSLIFSHVVWAGGGKVDFYFPDDGTPQLKLNDPNNKVMMPEPIYEIDPARVLGTAGSTMASGGSSGTAGFEGSGGRPSSSGPDSCWTMAQEPESPATVNASVTCCGTAAPTLELSFEYENSSSTSARYITMRLSPGTTMVSIIEPRSLPFGVQYELSSPASADTGQRGCLLIDRSLIWTNPDGSTLINASPRGTIAMALPLTPEGYQRINSLQYRVDPDNYLREDTEADNMIECTSLVRGCEKNTMLYHGPGEGWRGPCNIYDDRSCSTATAPVMGSGGTTSSSASTSGASSAPSKSPISSSSVFKAISTPAVVKTVAPKAAVKSGK